MKKFLSTAIVAVSLALAQSASAAVINGDFENVSSNDTGLRGVKQGDLMTHKSVNWNVYQNLPGWQTLDGSGIEVQSNRTLGSIDAYSGNFYIELDSHPKPNSNSTMAQVLDLSEGSYELSFFYSPRNGDVASNGISYSVLNQFDNSLLLGDVTGPDATNGTQVGLWTRISAIFSVSDTDSPLLLSFSAIGKDNSLGGFIDDITVVSVPGAPVPVPLPAGMFLMLTALGGLAWQKRRLVS